MIRVALRGLAGRKFRTVLTAIAIVLGVAMMSGAYVLTDTIDKAFSAIFVESYADTDAVVSGKEAGISFEGEQSPPAPIAQDVLEQVRGVDGVELAVGSVTDSQTRLLKPDGETIETGGAPSFAYGLDTAPDAEVVTFAKALAGRNDHAKVAYGTEAGLFQHIAEVPTVVIGPGSIDQAHKADEWIETEQLAKCDAFIDRLIERCSA